VFEDDGLKQRVIDRPGIVRGSRNLPRIIPDPNTWPRSVIVIVDRDQRTQWRGSRVNCSGVAHHFMKARLPFRYFPSAMRLMATVIKSNDPLACLIRSAWPLPAKRQGPAERGGAPLSVWP